MADNEAAVPKFGEWNDRDATAPDNYTAIFKQVREGRQDPGISSAPTLPRSNVNNANNQNHEHNQKKCCCFPWPRK